MLANNTGKKRRSAKRSASLDLAGNNSKNLKTHFAIPTSNRFSALPNDAAKTPAKNPPPPAPVTITDGTNPAEILKKIEIPFKLKASSIGTKIFTESVSDFTTLCDKLTEQKIEFFTHAPANKKSFKLVLHGLPEVPTEEITKCLTTQYNIKAEKITMLKSETSFKRYLIMFDAKENSKSDVTNIKVILNHIIRWLPAKRINRGPTQCLNCGMYGHGISACFRKSKCSLCGGDHETKVCSFQENANDQRVFKCHYCRANNLPNYNHRADDPSCPARSKYIEIKSNVSKNTKHSAAGQYMHTANSFPPLPPPPLTRSFADAAKVQREPSVHRTRINDNSGDLFTFAEISKMMFDCVNDLAQCTNKFDQLKVIANLLSHACK